MKRREFEGKEKVHWFDREVADIQRLLLICRGKRNARSVFHISSGSSVGFEEKKDWGGGEWLRWIHKILAIWKCFRLFFRTIAVNHLRERFS